MAKAAFLLAPLVLGLVASSVGACGRPLDLEAPSVDAPQSTVIAVSAVGLFIGNARSPAANSSLVLWTSSSSATNGLTQVAVHLEGDHLQVVDWTLGSPSVTETTTEYQSVLDGAVAAFCTAPGGPPAAPAITAFFSAVDRSFSPPSADVMLGCPISD